MIDDLARAAARDVSRETFERLQTYVELLKAESLHQNLVSESTMENLWDRHILDSAQLLRFEPNEGQSWVDIGSGAGLPGIVIACLGQGPITLIEPRRLRAEFLSKVVETLDLNAAVVCAKVERIGGRFDVITARAVASLSKILEMSQHLSTGNSLWVLPKGRSAQSELVEAQRAWQGSFRIEQSVTDEESFIVVGTGVRARKR